MEPVSEYRLRLAKAGDCEAIFAIRNKKEVRESSFDTSPLDLPGHRQWFEDSLENNSRQILVLEKDGEICGVLRFDFKGNAAEISLYLDPAYFGQGLGKMLLEKGMEWLKNSLPSIKTLKAKILTTNLRSANLFAKNGFKSQGGIWTKTL